MTALKDKSVATVGYTTREQWLEGAVYRLAAQFREQFAANFGDAGIEHLANISVSAGFPSVRGVTGKVIGECWASTATENGTHHIFISPLLGDPVRVLDVLLHEMIHAAADDGKNSHKGPFTKCARACGLEGKPTATVAGMELKETLGHIAADLGAYPHSVLKPGMRLKPKQSTRMLKVVCPECGCTVRMTRKWLDDAGAPYCGFPHKSTKGNVSRIRMEEESTDE